MPLLVIALLLASATAFAADPPNFAECCEMRGQPDVAQCRKDAEIVKLCTPGAWEGDVKRKVDAVLANPPKDETDPRRQAESLKEKSERKKREVEARVREMESQ